MNDIKVPPFTDGQKQLIEMTEKLAKKCDKISVNINKWGRKNICDVDGIDDDITDIKELLNDTIKRIEEPTNEDWLHTLNTEQLAEWVVSTNRCKKDHLCCVCRQKWCDKKYVVEWLKQPHTK